MASSFLCFALPSFSYSLSPGKPSTGADWLACHLNRCPASKRGARLPSLQGNLPLASRRRKRPSCPQGRESLLRWAFHSWSGLGYFRKTSLCFSASWGTVVSSGRRACFPQIPGEGVYSHCWGLSLVCGVLEASVFSDSVPSCQGNKKKAQLIFFVPLSEHLLKHIPITPQAFADLPIHSPI